MIELVVYFVVFVLMLVFVVRPLMSKFLGVSLSLPVGLSKSEKKELAKIEKTAYYEKCKELAKVRGSDKAVARYEH